MLPYSVHKDKNTLRKATDVLFRLILAHAGIAAHN
jgi:hypothetical protein